MSWHAAQTAGPPASAPVAAAAVKHVTNTATSMSVLRLQRYPHIKNCKLDYQIVNISMQPHGLQAAVASEFAAASTWEVMLLLVGRLQAQKFTSLVLIQQQLTSIASSCEAATALAASSATVCISKTRHGMCW